MLFLGDDLLAYLALALGGALFVGNIAAIIKPPSDPNKRGVTRPPIGRSLLFGGIGLFVAVWALATLLSPNR